MIQKIKETSGSTSLPQGYLKPSKLFPNVDVSAFNKPAKTSADLQPPATGCEPFPVPNARDRNLPHTQHSRGYHTLPAVNLNDMLKRVHLPYLGREQSYIWYLQLKSSTQQYGVYLLAPEDFQMDKSLFPTEVYGIVIDAARYNDMKSTLYQFLAQRTIIMPENTDLRNIVKRHALQTDGYQVLYKIMQRIHPMLDPDSILSPPESKDYSDVHEYYHFFDSYLMHEKHSGRHYTAREKVNLFIRGLDPITYNSAITRIRQQMDSWQPNDQEGPDLLKLPKLPNLVEKYTEDAGSTAVIHRFERRPNDTKHKEKPVGKRLDDPDRREYVDILCPLCQTHGHPKQHCDRMALWLLLKDASKNVDDKLRNKTSGKLQCTRQQTPHKEISETPRYCPSTI
jgi:hypothetical protein